MVRIMKKEKEWALKREAPMEWEWERKVWLHGEEREARLSVECYTVLVIYTPTLATGASSLPNIWYSVKGLQCTLNCDARTLFGRRVENGEL